MRADVAVFCGGHRDAELCSWPRFEGVVAWIRPEQELTARLGTEHKDRSDFSGCCFSSCTLHLAGSCTVWFQSVSK